LICHERPAGWEAGFVAFAGFVAASAGVVAPSLATRTRRFAMTTPYTSIKETSMKHHWIAFAAIITAALISLAYAQATSVLHVFAQHPQSSELRRTT
jgi:hypothetical protein